MTVSLKGEYTEEQRSLLEAALQSCPVHNTLSEPPRIHSRIEIKP